MFGHDGHQMDAVQQRLLQEQRTSRGRNNPASPDSIISQLRQMQLPDSFWMYEFKVTPCSQTFSHKWSLCPCAHAGETARRRDPRTHAYRAVPCPHIKMKKVCPMGDSCPWSHSVFEHWLHPSRYKTRLCSFGRACSRPCCFFAHDASELRYVPMSEEGKEQEEREQLVQLMMAQDAAGSMSMATGSNDLMGMAGTLGSTRQLPGMHMQGCAGMAHMQGAPQGQRLHHSLSQGLSGTGGYGELGLSSAASASLEELMSGMRVSLPGSGSDQHMGMPVMRMSVPGTGHDQQLAMAGLRMTYSGTPSEQQQQQQLGASMHVSMPQPQVQQAMGGYDGMGRHNRAPPPRSHSSLAAPSASSSSASASMHAGLRQHHQDQVDAASLLLGLQQSLNMATDGAWAAAGADMPNARLSDPGTAHAHINPLRHLSRISDSGQTLGLATPAIRDLENLLTSALAGAASLSNGATSGGTSGGALRSPAPDQQQQQDAGLASQRSSPSAGSGSQVLSADQQDGSRSSGNLQPSQQPGGTQAGANPADEYVKGLVTQLQQQGIVTSKQQLVDSLTQLLSQLLHSA